MATTTRKTRKKYCYLPSEKMPTKPGGLLRKWDAIMQAQLQRLGGKVVKVWRAEAVNHNDPRANEWTETKY